MARRDFGRYKIVEEVGRGAMGVVYRATDPMVGRSVAIKAINQSYLEGVGVKASEYFERFQREAEVAGRLNHPNILKIFDLGNDYLVMEFIEGQSLASLLRAHVRMTPEHILQVIAEVASALDYAHAQNIVHRDVKPANIMVQPDGSAKVMDFGLARVESSTLTAAGEVLGSASYMAPEAVLGQIADARSDIFSLGVVAYEMMTGDRPFGGASITVIIQNIVHAKPRPARQLNLHLPPDYDAIFERVLAKRPEDRYPTASQFASALALRTWAEPELPTPPTLAMSPQDLAGVTLLTADIQEVGALREPTTIPGGRRAADKPPEAAPSEPRAAAAPPPLPPGSHTLPLDPSTLPVSRPGEDDTPLAALLDAASPNKTLPPGTPLPASALDVIHAARRAASEVLPPDAVTPVPGTITVPGSAFPPARRSGVPAAVILGVAAVVLLLAFGVSVFAYRALRRAQAAPAAPSVTVAPQPASVESPVTAAAPTLPVETPPTPAPSVPPTTVVAARALLSIASNPSGARVTIGKAGRGVTPLRLELPTGKLSVAVEKDGFKPWRRDVILFSRGLTLEARLDRLVVETPPAPKPTPTPPGVKAGDLVALGPDVTPPKRVVGGSPRVPSGSKQKLTGSVVVEFVIDEDGRVRDERVVESAGNALDAACLEAVRAWRYEPATTQGVKVKVLQRSKFTFLK